MDNNKKLKEIIERMNTHPDEKLGKELEIELKKAELLVPVIFPENHQHNHDEEFTLEEETPVGIVPLSDEEGNIYLPAFTDEEEVLKSENEMHVLLFDLKTIKEIVLEEQTSLKGIVINPFSDYAIAPPRETILDILDNE